MKILVDIGGTYARFAVVEGGIPARIKKYEAASFKTFEEALAQYLAESGVTGKVSLLIATAAHPDEQNVWRFVNRNQWEINVGRLGNVEIILNDFEAATWGLVNLREQKILKVGRAQATAPRVLIGPGTGLGLGYLLPMGKDFHVQGTQGGHLATAAITEEQSRVLQAVDRVKGRTCLSVYEDVVSGPGLYNLYAGLCALSDEEQVAKDAGGMMALTKSLAVKDAIRLFHEFFGLFAATVTVGSGAYGGLYLMGGVLDKLIANNLFDFAHFGRFFAGNYVPSVKKSLDQTPVFYVTEPHLALHGLIKADDA